MKDYINNRPTPCDEEALKEIKYKQQKGKNNE